MFHLFPNPAFFFVVTWAQKSPRCPPSLHLIGQEVTPGPLPNDACLFPVHTPVSGQLVPGLFLALGL